MMWFRRNPADLDQTYLDQADLEIDVTPSDMLSQTALGVGSRLEKLREEEVALQREIALRNARLVEVKSAIGVLTKVEAALDAGPPKSAGTSPSISPDADISLAGPDTGRLVPRMDDLRGGAVQEAAADLVINEAGEVLKSKEPVPRVVVRKGKPR